MLFWASQTERKRTDEQKVMEKEHEMLKLSRQVLRESTGRMKNLHLR